MEHGQCFMHPPLNKACFQEDLSSQERLNEVVPTSDEFPDFLPKVF